MGEWERKKNGASTGKDTHPREADESAEGPAPLGPVVQLSPASLTLKG